MRCTCLEVYVETLFFQMDFRDSSFSEFGCYLANARGEGFLKRRLSPKLRLNPHGKLLTPDNGTKTTMNEDLSPNKMVIFLLSGSFLLGVFYFLSGPTFLPFCHPKGHREVGDRCCRHSFFRFGGGGFKDLVFSSLQYLGEMIQFDEDLFKRVETINSFLWFHGLSQLVNGAYQLDTGRDFV